jgi:predicted SprT family Zn-dependent metalloprotease
MDIKNVMVHAIQKLDFWSTANTSWSIEELSQRLEATLGSYDRSYEVKEVKVKVVIQPKGVVSHKGESKASFAEKFIKEKFKEHGLDKMGWKYAFTTTSKRNAGCCKHDLKRLDITVAYVEKATLADIKDTILHEIAHALTPGHKHDDVWREKAISIGSSGNRTHNVRFSEAKYIQTCPNECFNRPMYRKSNAKRTYVCKKCNLPVFIRSN